MKTICIVVASNEYMASAGVRIRYRRISNTIESYGWRIRFQVLDDVRPEGALDDDAYLFSKCYEAKSFVLAARLRDAGKRVGIDFFDDYFSQTGDSRLISHRIWLRTMEPLVDFFLCSTPRMYEVASGYLPRADRHILQDPFDQCDPALIGQAVERRLDRIRATGCLDVGWFGVGDNPYFPVGLQDVVAFSDHLHQLGRTGLDVRLRIATNNRPLTASGLEMLRRLPVRFELEEWSEAVERDLLADSAVTFIPVNAQRFSAAKSLNRAMSALSAGSQVLSAGYGLYERLGRFVYRDAGKLLADIENAEPALNARSALDLPKLFSETGSLERVTIELVSFLNGLSQRKARTPRNIMLVHGHRSSAGSHKVVQKLAGFSVEGPFFFAPNLNYDVRLVADDVRVTHLELNKRAHDVLEAEVRELTLQSVNALGKPTHLLDLARLPERYRCGDIPVDNRGDLSSAVAVYNVVMDGMVKTLTRLFENSVVFVSEIDTPLFSPSTIGPVGAEQ